MSATVVAFPRGYHQRRGARVMALPLGNRPRRIGVDFDLIRDAARREALAICRRILPPGRVIGGEFVCLNPKRADRRAGSFRINIRTGAWADFATSDRGRDMIGLVAWRYDVTRTEAARRLAAMLVLNGEVRL